jgi:hypothetical protein
MNCRHCNAVVTLPLIDLGYAPPANAYRTKADLSKPELWFPLRVYVCEQCWLVQTEDYAQADQLFAEDYAYFSSTSKSWLAHAEQYTQAISQRLSLGSDSFVVEIASNDGYLLKNFVDAAIPCLGIEPTSSTAAVAEQLGIRVLRQFFGEAVGKTLAAQGQQADLIIGNNVYAHVPDINDFTRGLKALLKPEGTITLEFPHVLQLLAKNQFDTIYHEHFSYLSLYTVQQIFHAAGLRVWDVETLTTHGGSLRVFGCHQESQKTVCEHVTDLLKIEADQGLQNVSGYNSLQDKAIRIKNDLLRFLIDQKYQGKSVAAYGAAAKGNTLLNYAGIKSDLLPYVCDAATSKQGKFLPGSHIPVLSPQVLLQRKPDFVLILPWNIADEIKSQNRALIYQGSQFITAVPKVIVI